MLFRKRALGLAITQCYLCGDTIEVFPVSSAKTGYSGDEIFQTGLLTIPHLIKFIYIKT